MITVISFEVLLSSAEALPSSFLYTTVSVTEFRQSGKLAQRSACSYVSSDQRKHKSKHKNNIQLIDYLADDCQLSLKHLLVFIQSVNLRLQSRAKRVVNLTESILRVFEQSQNQNQNQCQINLYDELVYQK